MLAKMKLRNAVCAAICCFAPAMSVAQTRDIPIRQLSAANISTQLFSAFAVSIAELPDGRVLVRDNQNRRLMVFDTTLANATVLADAEGSNGAFYPAGRGFASPALAYRGDTILLADLNVPGFVSITPDGHIGAIVSHPISDDLKVLAETDGASVGFDNRGRFIYRAQRAAPKAGAPSSTSSRDTVAIVRADLDKRSVDTIAHYGIPLARSMSYAVDPATGKQLVTETINPYPPGPDAWAVLSTGTLGIVRGHDYHVDWIAPDGKQSSTNKMAFDWKPFTDADKLARTDSMKRIVDSLSQTKNPVYGRSLFVRRDAAGRVVGTDTVKNTIRYATFDQMPDYVPPIRSGAANADRDGNLWILPTTSARAQGGLLYDVVNEKDGLRERVQLPTGCMLTGFGRKGVVFLACLSEKQWVLQRRHILR